MLSTSRMFSTQTTAVMPTTGSAQWVRFIMHQISASTSARFSTSHAGWKSISSRPRDAIASSNYASISLRKLAGVTPHGPHCKMNR